VRISAAFTTVLYVLPVVSLPHLQGATRSFVAAFARTSCARENNSHLETIKYLINKDLFILLKL
jgi:hypothetical protein